MFVVRPPVHGLLQQRYARGREHVWICGFAHARRVCTHGMCVRMARKACVCMRVRVATVGVHAWHVHACMWTTLDFTSSALSGEASWSICITLPRLLYPTKEIIKYGVHLTQTLALHGGGWHPLRGGGSHP